MRSSFGRGGSSWGRMGGGSGYGGRIQMLRSVQRAVRTNGAGRDASDPFSNPTTNTTTKPAQREKQTTSDNKSSTSSDNHTVASSHLLPLDPPTSATSTLHNWPPCSSPTYVDEPDWVHVDEADDDGPNAFLDDLVFGPVPSTDEVQDAVFSLQEFLEPVSSAYFMKDRSAYNLEKDMVDQGSSPNGFAHRVSPSGTKVDWMEPSLQLCHSNVLQHYGSDRVYDAFHMLQHEPSVQRMVVSLSSDRAVWEAVLNNEVVRELRKSLSQGDDSSSEKSDKASEASNSGDLLSSFVTKAKAKIMELMNNLTKIVIKLFHPQGNDKAAEASADALVEKLRASFMLSVMVLFIVVLSRAEKASSP